MKQKKQSAKPRILFAASEVYPFIKTGGLADVACFLPLALSKLGYDIRIILPAYQAILEQGYDFEPVTDILLGNTDYPPVRLIQTILPDSDIPVYMLDAPDFFSRPGNPYQDQDGVDWADNAERFALFCRVIKQLSVGQTELNWKPDILHCNDWHTGLAPALLAAEAKRPVVIFNIHNLAYQGLFPAEMFEHLHLPKALKSSDSIEFYNQLSFIKGGLVYAEQIITVSPRYAYEITTPEFGCGLDGLLRYRSKSLSGILNGVDYHIWDPRYDPHIKHHYWRDQLSGKKANKCELQQELGLQQNDRAILIGYIGRLNEQKGSDLLVSSIPAMLSDKDVQFVMLGEGNAYDEQNLKETAQNYTKQMAVRCEYDESLAHRIQAGADIFLMPSRFEPCGLTQLYALRYGTIPVVHNTGGLADTIVDTTQCSVENNTATGFVFEHESVDELVSAIHRAIQIYRTAKSAWQGIMHTAMKQEFSWKKSAERYDALYLNSL